MMIPGKYDSIEDFESRNPQFVFVFELSLQSERPWRYYFDPGNDELFYQFSNNFQVHVTDVTSVTDSLERWKNTLKITFYE